jgi:hypothetical protein
MIYEGANGIQALDLVARKLPRDGGRAIMAFFAEVSALIAAHRADEGMIPYTGPLEVALKDLQQATMWFMNHAMARPDNAGAGAYDYMHLLGLVALAYMWAQMAAAARRKLAEGEGAAALMQAKLQTGRFFMERILPETGMRFARIRTGAEAVMALPAEMF